eukprot:m.36703 g.36703  ORF g.36703 m.36703 type:complete len:81 (-) comp5793_c0_seq1:90-332(-)
MEARRCLPSRALLSAVCSFVIREKRAPCSLLTPLRAGLVTSARSDISAMELFAQSNVNSDPWDVIAWLRPAIEKRLSEQN